MNSEKLSELLQEALGQLTLDLFPGQPWNGRSARALTRVGLGLIFTARADGARVTFVDSAQLLLFPRWRQRLSYKSRTAPTLLPLP